jgi:cell division septation protein DedD
MRALLAAGLVLALVGPVPARDLIRPAELPPADYAGQQYVDSKGCMFVRAGTGSSIVWVPRVSRQGTPVCGNPPSGRRVSVAEEIGAQTFAPGTTADPATGGTGAEPAPAATAPGGYFVSVGSFGVAANSDKAEARLRSLGYEVVRGRLQGGSSTQITVFAGPFPDAAAAGKAKAALRDSGFADAAVIGP